jgi:hypothetical protein
MELNRRFMIRCSDEILWLAELDIGAITPYGYLWGYYLAYFPHFEEMKAGL